jgi:hypothetical protein
MNTGFEETWEKAFFDFLIQFEFAEIFTAQGAPLVSLTTVANGKNLQVEKF